MQYITEIKVLLLFKSMTAIRVQCCINSAKQTHEEAFRLVLIYADEMNGIERDEEYMYLYACV